jgi:hypothetical protein
LERCLDGLDSLAPAMLNMAPMDASAPLELTVTFGPTSSILLRRAVAEATRHATTCAEIAPGVWRASFALANDPQPYARAHRLIALTGGGRPRKCRWRAPPSRPSRSFP